MDNLLLAMHYNNTLASCRYQQASRHTCNDNSNSSPEQNTMPLLST
jgi:hypothetical protein